MLIWYFTIWIYMICSMILTMFSSYWHQKQLQLAIFGSEDNVERDIREVICSLHRLTKVVFREAAPISSSASVLISLQLFNPCQQKEPKCDARDLGLVSRTIQCLTRWRSIHKVQKRSQKDSVSPSCLPSKEGWSQTKTLNLHYFHSHSAGRQ